MEVLGLEGYVWDDIEVVDYSVDFGDFQGQELGVVWVAYAWASEYMELINFPSL